MFLSTWCKSFFLVIFCFLTATSCGSTGGVANILVSPAPELNSEFPFPTNEPEVYQAHLFINGVDASRTFIARKGDKWRRDYYSDGILARSELNTDKMYSIDHLRKVYVEIASNSVDAPVLTGFDYFNGREHYDLEEAGREGSVIKYKVRATKHMQDEIVLHFDTARKMIVRQEFNTRSQGNGNKQQPSFIYELRDLKLEVDDNVFVVPTGYQKAAGEGDGAALITK